MRSKVTGIGLEIKKEMNERGYTVEDIAKNTKKLSKKTLERILNLEVEPYFTPEVDEILTAMKFKNEEFMEFIERWLKLYKKVENI